MEPDNHADTVTAWTPRRMSRRRVALRTGAAVAASAALAAGALALVSAAGASVRSHGDAAAGRGGSGQAAAHSDTAAYSYTTLDNAADLTFNQLLGINEAGVMAGYFGSGSAGHPNQGYLLRSPYGQSGYTAENFPQSVQTQVTGLNDRGVTVGFFSDQNTASQMNDNFGFYAQDGWFHEVNFPTPNNATPPADQLLGVNDHQVAVGFYTNGQGLNRGFEYDIRTHRSSRVLIPGIPNLSKAVTLTATAINNAGGVAGFYAVSGGTTDGFYLSGGQVMKLAVPGAAMTQPFGVNDHGEVVGAYTTGSGSSAKTHGFTWTARRGFVTVDDPSGPGASTVNGVHDRGDIVGFSTDGAGNTDGFLAKPATRRSLDLQAMPAGQVTFGRGGGGQLSATLSVFGLTPGSSHPVQLIGPSGAPVASFGALVAGTTGQVSQTLDSAYAGSIPDGSRLVIRNGSQGGRVADERIARTGALNGARSGTMAALRAVETGPDGASHGTPRGHATVSYDPAARTLTATVDASGLTPGPHAAHIHLGSCASQGGVAYMLMDLMANARGQIINQTRVISGVAGPMPATGWYLNLHQGDSQTILRNGQPTIAFRPLLCSDI